MNPYKSFVLALIAVFSFSAFGSSSSNASPFFRIATAGNVPVVDQSANLEGFQVYQAKHKRRYKKHRRHHNKRRYWRHRHHPGNFWYAGPLWIGPVITVRPPRYSHGYNQCNRWSQMCYRNWGRGSNYRGCMKFHRCK